ncbi:hypothetical protein V5O40_04015 [Micromonospora sp. S2-005]
MVLILESRSHLDLGDLPNLLAAELGVMTVRLERAIRSLDGVARVHVNRWGDGSAHLHMWFLARPYGRLQLRGTFLSLWDSILPPISEEQWRENLALVAAWLAEFGGRPLAEPPRIQWQAPSSLAAQSASPTETKPAEGGSLLDAIGETAEPPGTPGVGVSAESPDTPIAVPVSDSAPEAIDAAPQPETRADAAEAARPERTRVPEATVPLSKTEDVDDVSQLDTTADTRSTEATETTADTEGSSGTETNSGTDGSSSTEGSSGVESAPDAESAAEAGSVRREGAPEAEHTQTETRTSSGKPASGGGQR